MFSNEDGYWCSTDWQANNKKENEKKKKKEKKMVM